MRTEEEGQMQRRYNLLASIISVLVSMVCVDAQARIAFESDRAEHIINNSIAYEIYVMDNNGANPQNLTNNPHRDGDPAWFNSPFSVSPGGKKFTTWGRLK